MLGVEREEGEGVVVGSKGGIGGGEMYDRMGGGMKKEKGREGKKRLFRCL